MDVVGIVLMSIGLAICLVAFCVLMYVLVRSCIKWDWRSPTPGTV